MHTPFIYVLSKSVTFTVCLSVLLASCPISAEVPEFSASGEIRFRLENLDGQFRASQQGSDQALMARTLVNLGAHWHDWSIKSEIIDARELAAVADEDSNLSTGTNNPWDVLQLTLARRWSSLGCQDCAGELTLGRFTLDLGSRRFLARNRYRNTINNFTGGHWLWQSGQATGIQSWQMFYTHPILRQYDSDVLDNQPDLDETLTGTDFWGLVLEHSGAHIHSLNYLLGLNEKDQRDAATRDRQLLTLVTDLTPADSRTSTPWRVELAYQWGEASASRSSNETLDVRAYFAHGEWFYRRKNGHQLGVIADIASGDKDANDDQYNRFDTLYGARRFDFGPTGLYGPFARANIISPGVRWQTPRAAWGQLLSTWRIYRLAERADSWTTTGFNAEQLGSSAYVGHQAELRWRWQSPTKPVALEAGAAYLAAGSLLHAANKGDSLYSYGQITVTF